MLWLNLFTRNDSVYPFNSSIWRNYITGERDIDWGWGGREKGESLGDAISVFSVLCINVMRCPDRKLTQQCQLENAV